jgi:hypothetical protein
MRYDNQRPGLESQLEHVRQRPSLFEYAFSPSCEVESRSRARVVAKLDLGPQIPAICNQSVPRLNPGADSLNTNELRYSSNSQHTTNLLLSRLHGWPAGSPVNASSRTSRCATHDLEASMVCYSFSLEDLRLCSLPISRRTILQ